MNKILVGAIALSLLAAPAAFSQPYNQGGYDRDSHDQGGERHDGDRHDDGDHRGGWDHHRHGHSVCSWRHHQRVCWRSHGW